MSDARRILIGVTGGIGAGKSVVCRVCRLRGLPVYDCDREAKRLMDESVSLKQALQQIAGSDVLDSSGCIVRPRLAALIFSDPEAREAVNSLVHSEVRAHLQAWCAEESAPVAVVESAILASSGLAEMTDAVWLVDAPRHMRLARALQRGGIDRADLLRRMDAQRRELEQLPPDKTFRIINDGLTPLLPQIESLLGNIKN